MQIELKLLLSYREHLPKGHGSGKLELPPGSTIGQVLARLQIPLSEPKIILLNGRQAETNQVLNDGDLLIVFPPLEGG